MEIDRLFTLEEKIAVVTGGSRGIGYMIADGLCQSGVRVYITARKAADCEAAAAAIGAAGGTCVAIPADIASTEGRERLVAAVTGREPRLDILVNNAGATWGAPLEEYPLSGWDKVMDVNVVGLFELTRLFLPALRASAQPDDPARVINIGSIDGLRVPWTENYAYAASKAAVHMVTRQLAKKLAREHITVNAIAPGPFPSKMMAFALEGDGGAAVAASVPLGRIGRPEDVAGTVVFLSSRAGSYVTGTILPVDGGISA